MNDIELLREALGNCESTEVGEGVVSICPRCRYEVPDHHDHCPIPEAREALRRLEALLKREEPRGLVEKSRHVSDSARNYSRHMEDIAHKHHGG